MSIWVQKKNYSKRIYKYMTGTHAHPFYELYYLKSGSRTYTTDNGNEFRFSAGDFVCIRPGTYHLMRGMVSESVIIRFGESDIPPYLANDIKLCFDKLILVSYPPERTAELELMLDRMFSDFVSVGANSNFTMRMLFNVLLTDISRLIHSGSCKLLLTTNAKTNEIAEAAGFSNNSYFCHLFKTHIGITPGEYRKSRGMK